MRHQCTSTTYYFSTLGPPQSQALPAVFLLPVHPLLPLYSLSSLSTLSVQQVLPSHLTLYQWYYLYVPQRGLSTSFPPFYHNYQHYLTNQPTTAIKSKRLTPPSFPHYLTTTTTTTTMLVLLIHRMTATIEATVTYSRGDTQSNSREAFTMTTTGVAD